MERRESILLLLIAVVAFMDCLDGSIINVALPTISDQLSIDMASASWFTISYFAMMAGLLILFGRIANNTSIRKVLISGLVVFIISSFVCGIAESFEVLLIARIVQGTGAAMMGATVPMACVKFFSPRILAFAFAFITIGYSVGAAMGPALGGVLIEFFSWHWIFFINIPIGIILILLLMVFLPKEEENEHTPVDYIGAVLLFISILGCIMFFQNFSSDMVTLLFYAAVFVIFLILFAIRELRTEYPLLNVRMFLNSRFNLTICAYLIVNVVYLGLMYLLPFYIEIVLGYGSFESGMLLFIPPVVTLVFCIPIARWSDNAGRRWFCVATSVSMASAFVLLYFNGTSLGIMIFLSLILMGFTWAFCGGPLSSNIIETVEGESREMGSTMVSEAGYFGSTIGTALFASLFSLFAGTSGIDISDVSPAMFIDGFLPLMLIGCVMAVIAALMSYVVKDNGRQNGEDGIQGDQR